MLKKRLLRTCKNVMAAAICISLAVGLSACGETQGERRHLNDKTIQLKYREGAGVFLRGCAEGAAGI